MAAVFLFGTNDFNTHVMATLERRQILLRVWMLPNIV